MNTTQVRISELSLRLLDTIHNDNSYTEVFNAFATTLVALFSDYVVKNDKELTIEVLTEQFERFKALLVDASAFQLEAEDLPGLIKAAAEANQSAVAA